MLCDVCKQNQATVHLTEIVDEQMSEMHLCEECASQKGAQMESHFGLSDLLAGLADFGKPSGGAPDEPAETKTCAACGLTYEDFRKIGRLGCSECYVSFKRSLTTLLKRIHGSTAHTGKSPVGVSGAPAAPAKAAAPPRAKGELAELRRKLAQAIDQEAFEEAARLRDLIREHERNKGKKA